MSEVMDKWIFRRDPRHSWVTQAVCPHCGHVNAAHTDLSVDTMQQYFTEEHVFCFSCGKRVVDTYKTSL